MPVPDIDIARCTNHSTIGNERCTKYYNHIPPCSFIYAVDENVQPLTTERPDWLPDGHAFCPGNREKVGKRMWIDGNSAVDVNGPEPFSQLYYECEHGRWDDQASAWSAHAHLAPARALEAPPADPVFMFERFIDRLEDLITQAREQIKLLNNQ